MQRSALCRSRRELSNEYLLAKIGFDTAENEPIKLARSNYQNPSYMLIFLAAFCILICFLFFVLSMSFISIFVKISTQVREIEMMNKQLEQMNNMFEEQREMLIQLRANMPPPAMKTGTDLNKYAGSIYAAKSPEELPPEPMKRTDLWLQYVALQIELKDPTRDEINFNYRPTHSTTLERLTASLIGATWVKQVQLAGVGLKDSHLDAISKSVAFPHPSLRELDISENKLGSDSLVSFATALKKNTLLSVCSMKGVRMENTVSDAFVEAMKVNTTLTKLALDTNSNSRLLIEKSLRRNNDIARKKRNEAKAKMNGHS